MPLTLQSLDWFYSWLQQPTWKLAGLLFLNGLWIPFIYVYFQEVWEAFQFWVSGMWSKRSRTPIYLAIDVPSDTEQTPASMEAIFNQLAGAHGSTTWVESHWAGEFQDWFSFEIVSLEGYVQYIVRCPKSWRDLVEAAVYAQYPDAEISEVTDYTQDVPSTWPNEDWDFFGTGYTLDRPSAYPIRTYNDFEDKVRGELIDPMAALLEIMSKIGKGEQIWYQILAIPIVEPDWVPDTVKEINKLIDRKDPEPKKGGLFGFLLEIPHFITKIVDSLAGTGFVQPAGGEDGGDDLAKSPMFKLTPGEREILESMERKNGKLAYKCRIRIAYFGKRSVFSKARGVGPVVGAIKQFNDASRNQFKVEKHSWTKANYFFKRARTYQRMNSFYQAYVARSTYAGDTPGRFVLNSEELATIYHFPLMSVKAPLVMRTGAKKSEPPATLPLGESGGLSVILPSAPEPPSTVAAPEPPSVPIAAEPVRSATTPSSDSVPSASEPEPPASLPSSIPDESGVRYIEIPDEPPK